MPGPEGGVLATTMAGDNTAVATHACVSLSLQILPNQQQVAVDLKPADPVVAQICTRSTIGKKPHAALATAAHPEREAPVVPATTPTVETTAGSHSESDAPSIIAPQNNGSEGQEEGQEDPTHLTPSRRRVLERIAHEPCSAWKRKKRRRRVKPHHGREPNKEDEQPEEQEQAAQRGEASAGQKLPSEQEQLQSQQGTAVLDKSDRMMVQTEFLRLQQLSGKEFTVDCFSSEDGNNSLCKQFYSPVNSFFSQSLVNQHCWINPPFDMIRETLEHYRACKDQHPESISAVFCLPKIKSKNAPDWSHLVKGMQILHIYRVGTRLFTGPNPGNGQNRHVLPGIRHEIAVYYDPVKYSNPEPQLRVTPVVQPTGSVQLRTSHVMQVAACVAGVQSVAVLDTGAEETELAPDGIFLSNKFAQRHGLVIRAMPSNEAEMTGIDGQPCKVYGTVRTTIKMGHMVSQIRALVIDMDDKLDLICGETWLQRHKAVMDYGSKVCMFMRRGKKFLVRCIKPRRIRNDPVDKPAPKIMTLTQAKRIMRKKVWYCLALVTEAKQEKDNQPPKIESISDPRVRVLVNAYPTVFTDTPPKGGSRIQAEHECIPLPEESKPTFRPMFRYSPLEMAELEKRIQELLENGYIQPSTSPYGAPVLFVKKPRSEELRLVIDYRQLNKLTLRNRHPIPRIDDLLDSLSGAKVFSSVDLRQAYHQIKLVDSDKPKTAFRTPFGHYEWVTLSMGLTNAPAIFQSVVNNIFRPYLGKFVVVYLDDICVFSKTSEEHMKHLRLVLDKLKEYKLTVAWHKCHFFQQELLFLGHIITADGVRADPAKVEAVAKYPRPKDPHELRSFLGMANFFRRYISKFAVIAEPLTRLLKKECDYIWGEKQTEAFEGLKQALITAPVLKLPDWQSDSPFEITCDASYMGISGMLVQDQHPVAFESRKLNSAEKNYSPTELEMLAVVHCIKIWRCYIEGKDVHVYTDHKPNTTFTTNPHLNRRQARWADELMSYNIQWHYKPGPQNTVADALSRHPVKEGKVLLASTAAKLRKGKKLAEANPFLERVKQGYQSDPWFADPANTDNLTEASGVYTLADAIVVPDYDGLRLQVMQECHDAPYAGHPGRDKTLQLVKHWFWWPTVTGDVTQYVKSCDSCQRNKSRNKLPAGLLQPLPVPGLPWESFSMDMVVDLPQTEAGHDSITVFVDRLTKMVHLAPSNKTDTAKDVAQLFIKEVFRLHGMPKHMVTDRDPKFTSIFWKEFFAQVGTKHSLSSAYHPQTDGNTERVNRVMEDMLRHFVSMDQTNWDTLLPLVEFAINSSHHDSLAFVNEKGQLQKFTPFQLNYGRDPNSPLKALVSGIRKDRSRASRVQQFMQELQEAHVQAKKCLQSAQARQKMYADNSRRPVQYQLGQHVLLNTKNISLKMIGSPKFLPKYIGPFKVTEKINEVAYRLDLPPTLRIHNVFHVSLLEEYRTREQGGRVHPPPLPELIDGALEYEVEQILLHEYHTIATKKSKSQKKKITELRYLVKWTGYDVEHITWEPAENCQNCPEMVQQYWDSVEARQKAKQAQARLTGKRKR